MKTLMLFSTIATLMLFSCKKENTQTPQQAHAPLPPASLIGSWAMDSIYYKGIMYPATLADGTTDTLIFTSSTLWESQGRGTSTYILRNDSIILSRGTAPNRDWEYILSTNNLILKCDTETNYFHKF